MTLQDEVALAAAVAYAAMWLLTIVYIAVLVTYIVQRTGRGDTGGLYYDERFLALLLLTLATAVAGGGYIACMNLDWIGFVHHTKPCDPRRDIVAVGVPFASMVSYALFMYPATAAAGLLPSMRASTIVMFVFAWFNFTLAGLLDCSQWIPGALAILGWVVGMITIWLHTAKSEQIAALRMLLYLALTLRLVVAVLSRAVAASFRTVASDLTACAVVDIVVFGACGLEIVFKQRNSVGDESVNAAKAAEA